MKIGMVAYIWYAQRLENNGVVYVMNLKIQKYESIEL